MKRIVVCLVLICAGVDAICQLPPLSLSRQASSKINKKNWQKAEELLRKSLRKEAINPEAKYAFSILFLTSDYPKFNIDSAQAYLLRSRVDFSRASAREKEKMKRFPLDSVILFHLKSKIDSAGFARAMGEHTEKAYTNFLYQFGGAVETPKAIELRDEVAYADALRSNSYKGFDEYLRKYPQSLRAEEAKKRYEKLLFDDKTKDGKLASYVSFLKNYPATIYRNEVEKIIFEIETASGEATDFQAFIKSNPKNNFIKKASNILYYLEKDKSPFTFLNDSLKTITKLNKGFWVPIFKNGQFGFMDHEGIEKLIPQYDSIHESYLCGTITSDYLITSRGLVSRSGQLILTSKIDSVENLGLGFLKVKSEKCWKLVHESGFTIGNACFQDVKIIASRFVAIKEKGQWNMLTLTGKPLCQPLFDDIYAEDDIIVFVKHGKKIVKSIKEVVALADNNPWNETLVYDGIKALGQGHYLVNNGSLQGVLSAQLQYIIPLDRQVISQTPYGFLKEKNNNIRLTGINKEIDNKNFLSVSFYGSWIKLKEKNNLILFDGKNKRQVEESLDSVWFQNKIAFTRKEDSLRVYFNLSTSLSLVASTEIKFIKSVDSVRYFFASVSKKKTIVEISSGKKLFTSKADAIEYIGHGTFLVEEEGKKGLLNATGKVLLPTEYNAIVPTAKNYVSLLKDKKFGLYELRKRILIKPIYERNIIPYSAEKLVAFKNGLNGFVSWALKEESQFDFEEIQYWNDTTAWVKKNSRWMLYNMAQKKIALDNIKDFNYIAQNETEKVAVIHQGNSYGVISNQRGVVIAAAYADIVNLGTPEIPLYFTEKYIQEADIHVVIYYNSSGKFLRKQAYETKEYEKIYCDDR